MTRKAPLWHYLLFSLSAILADRATKYLVLTVCRDSCSLTPFLTIEPSINRGISWGIFSSVPGAYLWLVSLLVISITIGLAAYAVQRLQAGKPIWAELLVLSGSISNIFDRFVYGGVIDFIVLSHKQFAWPVFNVADICIVVGIFLMVLEVYRREWNA